MIINIRGTSGSGKSYVVYRLMEHFGHHPVLGRSGKIEVHRLGTQPPTYAIGKYTTACGGCDTVRTDGNSADEIVARLHRYRTRGNVIFEGLLVSNVIGRWVELAQAVPDFRWVFLNTSKEECVARITARRAAVGNEKPLNPKNTLDKHKTSATIAAKVGAMGFEHFYQVSSSEAVELIRGWLEG